MAYLVGDLMSDLMSGLAGDLIGDLVASATRAKQDPPFQRVKRLKPDEGTVGFPRRPDKHSTVEEFCQVDC